MDGKTITLKIKRQRTNLRKKKSATGTTAKGIVTLIYKELLENRLGKVAYACNPSTLEGQGG